MWTSTRAKSGLFSVCGWVWLGKSGPCCLTPLNSQTCLVGTDRRVKGGHWTPDWSILPTTTLASPHQSTQVRWGSIGTIRNILTESHTTSLACSRVVWRKFIPKTGPVWGHTARDWPGHWLGPLHGLQSFIRKEISSVRSYCHFNGKNGCTFPVQSYLSQPIISRPITSDQTYQDFVPILEVPSGAVWHVEV